ncbi:hypothetical protein Q2T41_11845 [Maribacter confluentis]|uniref:Uncharacterized protein n=1 Tax=Maribacter confluentis TaxID=1656093 RepID=A0ABT8RQZ5_9FLAO|nr:hypothetical protein [Maribacter confluentis]MDO1513349.1 hypothetical protein [Maribacter confluentis]
MKSIKLVLFSIALLIMHLVLKGSSLHIKNRFFKKREAALHL